jgi:hypothetical protein
MDLQARAGNASLAGCGEYAGYRAIDCAFNVGSSKTILADLPTSSRVTVFNRSAAAL